MRLTFGANVTRWNCQREDYVLYISELDTWICIGCGLRQQVKLERKEASKE